MSFSNDTGIESLGDGRYRGHVEPHWWVVRGPHGGYLAAILLRALMTELDDAGRHPRSFTVHFVAAPREGSFDIEARIERSGRSISTLTARATQGDEVIMVGVAAFSVPWEGFEFSDAEMPVVPSPEESFQIPPHGDGIPPFLGNFDMRWAMGDPPFSGSKRAELGGWFRLREPEVADAPLVACYMDAWMPVVFPASTERLVCPTIDLTIHFRRPLPLDGYGAEDLFFGRFWSHLSHEGLFEEDGELWTSDGELIAQSRQLAIALFAKA